MTLEEIKSKARVLSKIGIDHHVEFVDRESFKKSHSWTNELSSMSADMRESTKVDVPEWFIMKFFTYGINFIIVDKNKIGKYTENIDKCGYIERLINIEHPHILPFSTIEELVEKVENLKVAHKNQRSLLVKDLEENGIRYSINGEFGIVIHLDNINDEQLTVLKKDDTYIIREAMDRIGVITKTDYSEITR